LVQYYLQHLTRPDAVQRNNPAPFGARRRQRIQTFIEEEKAGQPENIDPLAGQVLGKYDRIRMANGPAPG
jgi:hypothetical protein